MGVPPLVYGRPTWWDVHHGPPTFTISPLWPSVQWTSGTLTTYSPHRMVAYVLNTCISRSAPRPSPTHVIALRRPVELGYLKALSLSYFSVEEISGLLQLLSLPQHGLGDAIYRPPDKYFNPGSGFCAYISTDFPPDLSPFTAIGLEVQVRRDFCTLHGVGHYAATPTSWSHFSVSWTFT